MRKTLHHAAAWALGVALAAPALGQSLEERLRVQLRNTAQQLQQLQSQQAQAAAAKTAAETERDAARHELTALRAEVQRQSARASRLADEQRLLQRQVQAQTASQHQQAKQNLLLQRQADAGQAESTALKTRLAERDSQYQQCAGKNLALYQAGRELLTAYEAFGTGDWLAIRQPFSGSARVLFDEKAQALGDRLYQGQLGAVAPADSPLARQ